MEVLRLKPTKKLITVYIFKKSKEEFPGNIDLIKNFLNDKNIKFLTLDLDINLNERGTNNLNDVLKDIGIPYYQLDIPEYALGYLYEEIIEKEQLFKELVIEYENLEDKNTYKALSLKNWIDVLRIEIEQKENNLSLEIRPKWIVKKMLDICNNCNENELALVHFIQEDICEDICREIAKLLRDLNVNVIQYTKEHNVKQIIF